MTLIFWISFLLLIYTFVGYPLSLLILNKFNRKNKIVSSDYLPEVEVILVVRNSESIVIDKINSLRALDYPKDKLKILIISDYSTDETVAVIENLNYPEIHCIDNQKKTSKSACINQAIQLSKAEVLFLTDVRQAIEPMALKNLVKHFYDKSVGAVSGELVFRANPFSTTQTGDFAEGMDAYWKYEKFIRKNESNIGSVPGVTGAIYALRHSYFKPIPDETLLDDVLIPMDLIMEGKKVLFESGAIAYDEPSSDAKKEKARKTRTLAGNWQLLAYRSQLLNPFLNPIWLQFVSHKVLRLFAPLFLVSIFLTSFGLSAENMSFLWFFYLQLVGFLIILLANYIPQLMGIKLIRITHSFLILMVFTVSGFWMFVTGKHLTIWK